MAGNILTHLDTILAYLSKWEHPVVSYLNEPIGEAEVEKLIGRTGLAATSELVDLYQWRNGTNVSEGVILDEVQFIPGFHLLSLQDSISNYIVLNEHPTWSPGWFPVFANGGGDFYALDLSKSDGKIAPVVGFILGETEQEIEYSSLSLLLSTFSECFDTGAAFVTEDGYLELADEKHAEIARKLNPDIVFWST